MARQDITATLAAAKTQNDRDLLALSNESKLLLVFLRHLG